MTILRRSLIATATLAGLAAAAPAFSAPAVGQMAPNFTLKDTSGKAVSLADFKGKHVVLEWSTPVARMCASTTTAPTCRARRRR